ncbi:uncharacterized protein KZ484_023890 [Pholidichthys leucotaenia]
MGGSSWKKIMFWKKKRSPLSKAFRKVKGMLPRKKGRKKAFPSLDKLKKKLKKKKKKKRKCSKKKTLLTDQKEGPLSLKKLSLGNTKESSQSDSPGKEEKDRGGLGERIKKKFSKDQQKELSMQPEVLSPENQNEGNKTNESKLPKKSLTELMKSIRPHGNKANGQQM